MVPKARPRTERTTPMVSHSPELKDLATALSKAQGELIPAPMDSDNPHYRSRFASLASVVSTARPVLSKHGLSVTQMVTHVGEKPALVTRLMHLSGQWVESTMLLSVTQAGMQPLGSAITYAKRYAFSAMVGIVAEDDDDGNSADGKSSPTAQMPAKAPSKPAHAALRGDPTTKAPPTPKNVAPASVDHLKDLGKAATARGVLPADMTELIKGLYGVDKAQGLKVHQVIELVEMLVSPKFSLDDAKRQAAETARLRERGGK